MPRLEITRVVFVNCNTANNEYQHNSRALPGADPGLILGCCQNFTKKLNIEMM